MKSSKSYWVIVGAITTLLLVLINMHPQYNYLAFGFLLMVIINELGPQVGYKNRRIVPQED